MSMSIGGYGFDASQLASNLFSKLDTKKQGYIDKSELASALSGASGSSDSADSSADALFTQLDTDGDGKITESELSSSLQTLADTLMGQLRQSQLQPPPPPPPDDGSDAGLTEDQLTSMASELSSVDSTRASLLSELAENFSAADTNADGKISRQEAMSFKQANSSDSASGGSGGSDSTIAATTAASTGSTSATEDQTLSEQVMLQLVALLRSYGSNAGADSTSATTLSVSA